MIKLSVLLISLVLAGCATTANYETKLNTFIGVSENNLIASWGVPDKEYHLNDGKKAVEYVHKNTIRSGGYTYTVPQTAYHSGVIGDKPYSGTFTQYVVQTEPVQQYKLFCKTSFIINTKGLVESWQHEGNDCVAR